MDYVVILWLTSRSCPSCKFPAMRDPVSGKHGGQHPEKQHPKLTYSTHSTHMHTLPHTHVNMHRHEYAHIYTLIQICLGSIWNLNLKCSPNVAGSVSGCWYDWEQGTLRGEMWVSGVCLCRMYFIQAVPISPACVSSRFSSTLTVRLYDSPQTLQQHSQATVVRNL